MPRLRRLAPLAVLLALLCSACKLELAVDVEARRDGSGTLAVSLAADDAALAAAQRAGASPLDDLREAGESLQGWAVDDRARDDGRKVVLSSTFADAAELERLTTDLARSLNAAEATLLQPFALQLSGGAITIDGEASLEPGAAVRDYGLAPQQVVRRLEQQDLVDYEVRVTFPGPVTDAGGGVVEGRTVSWDVEPGETVGVRATARRPPHPAVLVAAGAAGGLLAALAGWWLWRRRRRRADPAVSS